MAVEPEVFVATLLIVLATVAIVAVLDIDSALPRALLMIVLLASLKELYLLLWRY